MRFIISALALTLFISCSSDNKTITYPNTTGLVYAESEESFTTTYNKLRSELQQGDFTIYKEIDFKTYAESYRKRSRNAKMILFSNPSLETPLIDIKPELGLEFPTRILTFEDRDKFVLLAYNNTEYLSRVYNLNTGMSAVANMESSLSNIVTNVAGNMTLKNETATVGLNYLTVPSMSSFNDTYNRLRNRISDSQEMKLITEVDHQANARSIGLNIRPNKVLIFSTGEMEANLVDQYQLSIIDLPIRILVWEDANNKTHIAWQDIDTLTYRHLKGNSVDGLDDIRRMIRSMAMEAAEEDGL